MLHSDVFYNILSNKLRKIGLKLNDALAADGSTQVPEIFSIRILF